MAIEQYSPKLVKITETWFKDTSITNLNGYSLYRKNRSDERIGVCLYINKEINSVELNEQRVSMFKLELLSVILSFGKSKYLSVR